MSIGTFAAFGTVPFVKKLTSLSTIIAGAEVVGLVRSSTAFVDVRSSHIFGLGGRI